MAEENKEGGTAAPVDLASIVKQLETIAPQVQQLMSFMQKLKPLEEAEHGEALDKDAPPPAAKKEDGEAPPVAAGMDEATFVKRIALRDQLAKQISAHVGTFDHAEMTLDGVVAYGCDKLEIKADKGQEQAMLAGYLQAKPAATPAATVSGMDGAAPRSGNFVTKHLQGE